MLPSVKVQTIFLKSLSQALRGRQLTEAESTHVISNEEYASLLKLSNEHNVLPMVYESVCQRKDFQNLAGSFKHAIRQNVIITVSGQVQRTQRFLQIYQNLEKAELPALVVKGIICRNLYPNPDDRVSQDEDLFVQKQDFAHVAEQLQDAGMRPLLHLSGKYAALQKEDGRVLFEKLPDQELPYEITFADQSSPLKIELHKSLFPEDDAAYTGMNKCFSDAFSNQVKVTIDGVQISTLSYTEHLLFLVLHAYKHFVSGGFGIRQVCDLCMFAEAYGKYIDWKGLFLTARKLKTLNFAASLFALGEKYLGFDRKRAGMPNLWSDAAEDPDDLLKDILESGVFGFSDMNRKHSSNMTLHKVEASRSGQAHNGTVSETMRTAFPKREDMTARYPYLKQHPHLLPVAWLQRIGKYLRNHDHAAKDAGISLQIGKKRIRLLEEYGILDEKRSKIKVKDEKRQYQRDFSGTRVVSTQKYIAMLCELIKDGRTVSLRISGGSMVPFLVGNRDIVYLQKPRQSLRRGDIVLYQRDNGQYVLHRIQKVVRHKDGATTFRIIGDAQWMIERGIRQDQIFAIAVAAERKGKLIRKGDFWWDFFAHVWIRLIPFRQMLWKAYRIVTSLRSN